MVKAYINLPDSLRHCSASRGCQNISEDIVLLPFDGESTSKSYDGSLSRRVVCLAEIAV
jgi:hypothetical protein